jgi:hypothetical protein
VKRDKPEPIPVNEPSTIVGDMRVRATLETSERSLEASISLHQEPEEDILLLGLMMQDVAIQGDMLRKLPSQTPGDYRGNLIVCRGAAERLKQRCTRLLGDAETDSQLDRKLGTANGKPTSRKRAPAEANKK